MGKLPIPMEKIRKDVFLIHGVGKKLGSDYYDKFVAGIRSFIPIDEDVNFHPVDYSPLLDEKEEKIFSWMKGMGYQGLRKFGCDFLADVLAYSPPENPAKAGDFYFDVNEMLSKKFEAVEKSYPQSKKIIISHSLGTQIAFSFAWKKEIDVLFTCGSPIIYFAVRFSGFGKFPEATLKRMINFYNENDPVATIIGRNPALKKCQDIKVKSWNPRYLLPLQAHSFYFVSADVQKKIAEVLSENVDGKK